LEYFKQNFISHYSTKIYYSITVRKKRKLNHQMRSEILLMIKIKMYGFWNTFNGELSVTY